MGELSLLVPGPAPSPHRKITIARVDGRLTWTVPILSSIGLDNLAGRWTFQDRPGSLPISTYAGASAPQIDLEIGIGGDLTRSAEQDIDYAFVFARAAQPVLLSAGRFNRFSATGTYVITDLSIDDIEMQQGTNETAAATIKMTLQGALTPEQVQATNL